MDAECRWRLAVQRSQTLRLTLFDFELDVKRGGKCHEFLEVSADDRVYFKDCGSLGKQVLAVDSNEALVRFKTGQASLAQRGFLLYFEGLPCLVLRSIFKLEYHLRGHLIKSWIIDRLIGVGWFRWGKGSRGGEEGELSVDSAAVRCSPIDQKLSVRYGSMSFDDWRWSEISPALGLQTISDALDTNSTHTVIAYAHLAYITHAHICDYMGYVRHVGHEKGNT